MSNVLKISQLTKRFGKMIAVNHLSLSVDSGQVYGILGPNGSGKTTTLGMILEVIAPSKGHFEWFGGDDNVEARRRIGAILETPCFYGYLTAKQNLRIVAHIKQCGTANIDPVLRQVGLFERRNSKFKTYSLGMKQRLSLAAALLSDPATLIFDEPTNGLDPEGIAEVRQIIKEVAAKGKTIIMASHLLDEVQKVCSHFCVLQKGVKLYEGAISDITRETNIVEVSSIGNVNEFLSLMTSYNGKERIEHTGDSLLIHLKEGRTSEDINRFCFEKGVTLKKLAPQSRSLEQEFLKILKEND